MNSKVENCQVGQTLDEYLHEQGLYETVTIRAIVSFVIELNIDPTMLAQEVSKTIEANSKAYQQGKMKKQQIA